MTPLVSTIVQFVLAAAVILYAGTRLSRYGDVLAEKTGFGGTWIGLILMATVTSLPELITGASAVLVFDVPEIAVGDAIGSCLFNLVIFAFLDVRHPDPLSARLHQGHVLAASFGLVLMGLAALALLAGSTAPAIGWIGVQSLVFIAVYALAARTLYRFERQRMTELAEQLTGDIRYGRLTLRATAALFVLHAAVLVTAATFLPGIGERLAERTGLGQSLVGSLFVAASTSMPEVVVSVAAARIGALDLAASNLFGSNLFNIAILGIDDVLATRGPILASVAPANLVTILAAMVMTGIAIIGLTYRAQRKRLRLSWDSLAMVAMYAMAIAMLWAGR